MFSARFLLLWARWIGIESPFKTQVIKIVGKTSIWVFEHCLGRKKQKNEFWTIPKPKRCPLSWSSFAASGPTATCWSTYDTKRLGHRRDARRWFQTCFCFSSILTLDSLDHEKPAVVHIAYTSFIWYLSSISLPAIVIYKSYMYYFLTSCFTSTCIS